MKINSRNREIFLNNQIEKKSHNLSSAWFSLVPMIQKVGHRNENSKTSQQQSTLASVIHGKSLMKLCTPKVIKLTKNLNIFIFGKIIYSPSFNTKNIECKVGFLSTRQLKISNGQLATEKKYRCEIQLVVSFQLFICHIFKCVRNQRPTGYSIFLVLNWRRSKSDWIEEISF